MATVPSETTAVAGTILTAATWNSNVRDAVNFLINRPVCEARQTVAQSLTSGSGATITYDTNDVDTDGGHSTVTNTSRYTAQTAGRFQLSGAACYASNATGAREANFFVNGTLTYSAKITAVSGDSTRVVARTITRFLNVGDYVELGAFQNSGGALNTAVTQIFEQSTFSLHWMGTT